MAIFDGKRNRKRIIAAARKWRLVPLIEALNFQRLAYRSRAANGRFLNSAENFTPPPLRLVYEVGAHTSYEHFAKSGRADASTIEALIDKHVPAERPVVADWGCGIGRILSHLPSRYQLHGFDVSAASIAWCRRNIAGASFSQIQPMPPLLVADQTFDAVYAVSIFTHLSAQGHSAWIEELRRVLRPGGVLIASFHGSAQTGGLSPKERALFDGGELVVRAGTKEGSRAYVAYHPDSYVKDTLLSGLDILEGPIARFGQTVWIARRR